MFGYYIDLAWRSLKRTPVLTALMVLAIGLGIGASMTMITVLHVMTEDPLPGRSAHLYVPHLDPLPVTYQQPENAPEPNDSLTWPDAMALLRAHRATRQAAMAGGTLLVTPQRANLQPFDINGRYATSDFFAMFGVPFMAGSGWTAGDDVTHAHVVVLAESLARKLFGDANPVGQTVELGNNGSAPNEFRVIGVTRDWAPRPMFYEDSAGKPYSDADEFFLPLTASIDLKLDFNGNFMGWGRGSGESWRTSPRISWLQFWVQLDTPEQVKAYHQFLVDYSAEQKALGRFQRPATNAKLYSMMGWLAHENLVPDDVRLQFWLAIGFLGVAMLNIVALLLAKFLRRSSEISVRRAMGARKRDIFVQFGIESALIGVAGGLLGLGIAQIGLWSIRQRPDDYAHLASMDPSMLIGTVLLAIVASVLAGLLPAWRACRVPPALQLKTL
ncbi:MAG: ABC transporter, ATP-binding protein [Rhodanobacteraceae bacterium]|jgi:putative ABC transport system permease protein|nr:MAG: ABC transporter, ATP-binding protein [Rhodanobacteraceae bacterium]